MKTKELIDEKKSKKEIFSLHTLVNEDKVAISDIDVILQTLLDDEEIHTYFFLVCPKCSNKVMDGGMSQDLFKNQKTCNACKNKFKPELEHCEFVFDPRPLKDRI
jgi:hypothetical protein